MVPEGTPAELKRTTHTLPDGMVAPQSEVSTVSPLPLISVIAPRSKRPGPVLRIRT
jgi:hypothetical protein